MTNMRWNERYQKEASGLMHALDVVSHFIWPEGQKTMVSDAMNAGRFLTKPQEERQQVINNLKLMPNYIKTKAKSIFHSITGIGQQEAPPTVPGNPSANTPLPAQTKCQSIMQKIHNIRKPAKVPAAAPATMPTSQDDSQPMSITASAQSCYRCNQIDPSQLEEVSWEIPPKRENGYQREKLYANQCKNQETCEARSSLRKKLQAV